MSTVLIVLACLGALLLPGILTRVLLPLFYALAVRLFGERRFVEPDSLDGCSYIVNPAIVSVLLLILFPVIEKAREKAHHLPITGGPSPLWVIVVVPVFFAIYGVVELWQRGIGHGKQEFKVAGGKTIRLDDEAQLHPTFIIQKREYHATTPASGYTFYDLTLHDADGPLAQNDYLTECEAEQTLDDVIAIAAPEGCRAMEDLRLVWDKKGKRLHHVYLGQQWLLLICGLPCDPISSEREWWDQWLLPTFPKDGQAEVNSNDFSQHLLHLHQTYSDAFTADKALEEQFQAAQLLLQRIESGVQLMARGRFITFTNEWRGGKMMTICSGDGIQVSEIMR